MSDNSSSKKSNIFLIILAIVILIIIIWLGYTISKSLQKDKTIEISYDIVSDSNNVSNKTIIVNGKNTSISGVDITNVNKLKDALIFMVSDIGSSYIYVVDENGNTLNKIVGSSIESNSPYISAKGNVISENYLIDGNDITVVSNSIGQDPVSTVCYFKDDQIVKYTEKFIYLGSGRFSNPEVINQVSAKEYKSLENIKCE